MGIDSDALLIYGIPVLAFDEDKWDEINENYMAGPLWDVEQEYWVDDPEGLTIISYGHYADPDNQRSILSIDGLKPYHGDCWNPTGIKPSELIVDFYTKEKGNKALRAAGLPGDFHTEGKWYLVASVG